MKVQSKTNGQWAQLDDSDAGEGLSVFFGQGVADQQRWQLDVYAQIDNGADMLIGTVYVSPPTASTPVGPPTRQVLAAVCPGAKKWSVFCRAVGQIQDESINIELASSKCCTAPVGVTRVSERYGYTAGSGTVNIPVLPGQTVTGISAFGLSGGGTIVLNGGATITVPDGVGMNLAPGSKLQFGATAIAIANCDYVVEFLESA